MAVLGVVGGGVKLGVVSLVVLAGDTDARGVPATMPNLSRRTETASRA